MPALALGPDVAIQAVRAELCRASSAQRQSWNIVRPVSLSETRTTEFALRPPYSDAALAMELGWDGVRTPDFLLLANQLGSVVELLDPNRAVWGRIDAKLA